MRTTTRHAHWLVLALLAVVALTGCYRSAGGSLEPTPVDRSGTQQAAVNTPIPMPSFTPLGEGETPTASATSTEVIPTAPPIVTNTPLPTSTRPSVGPTVGVVAIGPSPTGTAVVVAVQPSSTPWPTNTPSPWPTLTPLPTATNTPPPTFTPIPTTPVAVAMGPTATITRVAFSALPASPTYTPFLPPASPTYGQGEAIPLAERPTETIAPVDGQGGMLAPTETPLAVAQQPTLSVNQMTATALVFQTTATAAALQGIPLPTLTPIPGQPTPFPTNPPVFYTPTPVGMCGQHLVSPGETLSRIALMYNVTTDQMATANNIVNPDLILAGATLTVPCPAPAATTTVDTSGQGGQGTVTTAGGQTTYTVEPGDNLYRISIRFGVTMTALMQANGMTPATINFIRAGQQLIIPAAVVTQPVATPYPTPFPTVGLVPQG